MKRIEFPHNSLPLIVKISKSCPHCGTVNYGSREYCLTCFKSLELTEKEKISRTPVLRFGSWYAPGKAVRFFLFLLVLLMAFILSRVQK